MTAADLRSEKLALFVGNQRYSSWSLRPWICLAQSGLAFDTVVVRFDDPDFAAKVGSDTAKVPALAVAGVVVHESLAICELVAELVPEAGLWPSAPLERARARALASEMHAGFGALRRECPMDVCRAEPPGRWPLSAAARADVARIDAVFSAARGPMLFGAFGVVDAMYAPVVTRVLSYGLALSPEAMRYVAAVRALPAMASWYAAGERERELGWGHYASSTRAPRDHEDAMDFALRWAEAWNRRDVEAVLAHFDEGVVFTSPRAAEVVGQPTVRGIEALRAYWRAGVARLPADLRFEIEGVDHDPATGVLLLRYLRREGERTRRACERLCFDARTGRVTAGEAYYGA